MASATNLKALLKTAEDELQFLAKPSSPDFRLEQAVFNEKEEKWEIVVSFLVDNPAAADTPTNIFSTVLKNTRIYKKVLIDKNNRFKGFFIYQD